MCAYQLYVINIIQVGGAFLPTHIETLRKSSNSYEVKCIALRKRKYNRNNSICSIFIRHFSKYQMKHILFWLILSQISEYIKARQHKSLIFSFSVYMKCVLESRSCMLHRLQFVVTNRTKLFCRIQIIMQWFQYFFSLFKWVKMF